VDGTWNKEAQTRTMPIRTNTIGDTIIVCDVHCETLNIHEGGSTLFEGNKSIFEFFII